MKTETPLINSDENTVLFNYDSNTRTFTWDYLGTDNGPVLPDLQSQDITLTATSGSPWTNSLTQPAKTDSEQFTVNLVDPCLDPDTTTIIPQA